MCFVDQPYQHLMLGRLLVGRLPRHNNQKLLDLASLALDNGCLLLSRFVVELKLLFGLCVLTNRS